MKIHKKLIAIAFAVAITINSGILTVLANNEQADSTIKQVDLYPIESESNDIFESENTEEQSKFNCNCMNIEDIITIDDLEQIENKIYRKVNLLESDNSANDSIDYEGKCGENVNYKFDSTSKTLYVTGEGEMYNYNIDTYPWNSFKEHIDNINIGNGITKIGNYSFFNLGVLNSVDMGESIESIGVYAFGFCSFPANMKIKAEKIEQCAFYGCNFQSNNSIQETECNLDEKLLEIEGYAFAQSNITIINIPKNVKNLSYESLSGIPNLKNIKVCEENQNFSSDYGMLFNKSKTILITIPSANNWKERELFFNYKDTFENHYLIYNNILFDYIPNENNGVLNTEEILLNCNYEKGSIEYINLIYNKSYENINDIIIGENVKISDESFKAFETTGWYEKQKNTDAAVIYNSSKSYKILFKYHAVESEIDLKSYDYIGAYAFNKMKNNFSVKLSYDEYGVIKPSVINEKAFVLLRPEDNHEINFELTSIKINTKDKIEIYRELSYTDLQLNKDEFYITCGDSHAGIFKDENSFKIQLIKAIMNNENYRDKLEDDFCQKIIEKNKWRSLAEQDPYEAYYSIFSWVCKNRPYMGWWSETTEDLAQKSYNNKYYYDYSQTISSHTLGGAITGYTICGGHARTIDDIVKNLNLDNIIKSDILFSSTHAWNIIGIKSNDDKFMKWYYSDIGLTMNGNNHTVNGVSLMGHYNFKNIAMLCGDAYKGFYLEDDNLEAFKNFLINNNIIYNGIKEYEIKTEENCGELAESNYGYNKKYLNIKVNKIAMETNDIISLSLPENIISYEYHNKEESQGYYVFSDEDIDNIIINTFVKKYNMLLVTDFSDTLIDEKNNSIFGGSAKFDDGYEIYIYGKRVDNTLDIIVSDKPEKELCQTYKYTFKNNANIIDYGIKAINGGAEKIYLFEEENEENKEKVNKFSAYSDFNGKIYLSGVEVFDINNYEPEDLMGAITVLDNCVQRNIGYNITITYDEETKTKNITLETFDVGDVNANGIVDQDDLTLLLQFLTAEYHFIQTGSDGDLRLEAPNITLNGDIASNGKFNIKANNANFNGTIYANGGFNTEISGAFNCNGQKSGIEFPMDLITETFNDKAMMEWCFKDENIDYSNDENNIYGISIYNDKDKYIEDINESYMSTNNFISFIGNYNVYKNQKSINDLTVSESDIFNANAVLYSEKGNITINSKNCTINGFIYAPNGKVTITSENLNVTGTIVAKEIEVITKNSFNFTIAKTDEMRIKLTELQMLLSDLNMDNKINVFDSVILKRKLA